MGISGNRRRDMANVGGNRHDSKSCTNTGSINDWRNHGRRTSSYTKTPITFGFFAGCPCLYHFYSCLSLVPWSPKMPAYTRAPKGQGYSGGRLLGWFEANTATLSKTERCFLRLSLRLWCYSPENFMFFPTLAGTTKFPYKKNLRV